jgi:hypothetical protein
LFRNPTRVDPQKPVQEQILDALVKSMGATATQAEKTHLENQQMRRCLQNVNKDMREIMLQLVALNKQSEKHFQKLLEEINSIQRSYRPNQPPSRAPHKRGLDDDPLDPYREGYARSDVRSDPYPQYVLIPSRCVRAADL